MRRVLAILSAFVLLFMTVGGAAGGRVFRETEHIQDVGCWNITAGSLTVEFYARISDVYGTEAYLDAWDGQPYASDPVYSATGSDVEMTFGPTVTISIPLAPSGTAEITGSITPVEAIDYQDRFRDGNVQYRGSGTGTYYAFEGMLQLPEGDPVAIGPVDCSASDVVASTTFNQPHARVFSWTSSGGSCSLTNDEEGISADVFFGLDGDEFLYLDAFVFDSGGAGVGMFGAGDVVGGQVSLVLDEYDLDTGDSTGKQGSAQVTLSETDDDVAYILTSSNTTLRVKGSLIDVAGWLDTSLGSFDLDACVASITRSKELTTPSSGPKPGGKRPANDLPSGAITLKTGSKTTVATKGAQPPREADYSCTTFIDFDGTEYVAPVEHTVWYRIAGTGKDVTVDTAGSSFDTVIAVYAGGPDGAEVACVDDVPVDPIGRSLQSAVTFAAEPGLTYYVQIGGYQEGDSVNVPYGTLRVAVR